MTHSRPDPDDLLRRVQDEESRARRGRLKVFLGAAPGVGKTFTMLEAARAQRAEGLDVVVGVVETHGRAETAALLEDLETIPKRPVEYRESRLQEFDIDAAIARHPALLLVDELAHTNVPGSRHAKRWQDVEELLARGINVYTTLNVQHLESLNDVVAGITGVQVRETIPGLWSWSGPTTSSWWTSPRTCSSSDFARARSTSPMPPRGRSTGSSARGI